MARRAKRGCEKPIALAERSLESGLKCFIPLQRHLGVIDASLESVLKTLLDFMGQDLPKPDLMIYVRCQPEVSRQRITKRSREEEDSIPMDYIGKLHELHVNWLVQVGQSGQKVIVFENDLGREDEDREAYVNVAKEIVAMSAC